MCIHDVSYNTLIYAWTFRENGECVIIFIYIYRHYIKFDSSQHRLNENPHYPLQHKKIANISIHFLPQ